MSGLLALLDDVAGIAKVAAASVDDVAGMAAKAGGKAAGALIDDAAVTPKYVTGFHASRELPIVGKIAWGSIKNKMLILLPAALLLSLFAPWLITPLLMIGGGYLCFEGAEKVLHWLRPHHGGHGDHGSDAAPASAHLEQERVAGAIKTDFILSAEIMTIALSTLPQDQPLWMKAIVLTVVAIGITVAVYGAVALIVKADDAGVALAARGGVLAPLGTALVKFMPFFLKALMVVGTAAMVWVGGQIIIHGMHDLGQHQPYEWIHHAAESAAHAVSALPGLASWVTTAFFDGIFGLVIGFALIPLATKVIIPLIARLSGGKAAH